MRSPPTCPQYGPATAGAGEGGPEGDTCIGTSAGVAKLDQDGGGCRRKASFVPGLSSGATKDGGFATGLDGVFVSGAPS
ncbi:hypothetical protein [Streptomyces sp. NPDC052225]|uniref:hypothetical protein n=1 Tax=Streptomyces sp. NPDC052225 TaxID=3154949 RepID=UPI003420BF7D